MKFRNMASLRFMRDHRWTSAHLSEYIDHELDEPARRRVEEHVGLCPKCHRMLATLRRTVSGLGSLRRRTVPAPGDAVAEGVLDRFREDG